MLGDKADVAKNGTLDKTSSVNNNADLDKKTSPGNGHSETLQNGNMNGKSGEQKEGSDAESHKKVLLNLTYFHKVFFVLPQCINFYHKFNSMEV